MTSANGLDAAKLDALSRRVLMPTDKGIPPRAAGMTVSDFLATAPTLDEFGTPILVLSDKALAANADTVQRWIDGRGFALMPHGKTTMSPQLWQLQLERGAAGLTLATPWQVRTARAFGATSVQLANTCVAPADLDWLASHLHDETFTFSCWVDSVETVAAMEAGLDGAALTRPVDVLVELGAAGGRTGARSIDEAVAVARRVSSAPALRLSGIAGYEGSLGHDRSSEALSRVRDYVDALVTLTELIAAEVTGPITLSIGGSAYLDLVAEGLEIFAARDDIRCVVRSGASLVHDDGFYHGISPLDDLLAPAMRGYARVVSHPEPGLALLDAGKRDLPYDEGLPRALDLELSHTRIDAMNDQHCYLRAETPLPVAIGDVVTLGLSHPCTAFDKWRVIPVVRDHDSLDVVDLLQTFF